MLIFEILDKKFLFYMPFAFLCNFGFSLGNVDAFPLIVITFFCLTLLLEI